ncbi:PREDICTED: synaptojanin-1-like [Nicrophorus vespilloides]|uniref:phosphoinositide 5-phosphatase n=1 Tax=Nicrophorus vespilloides TaxID=110193 RepID=A0ABM1N4P7_NICVS|nr:PREDICTED: synaptojanin-1-like [Nicrophorus vespilloides]
MALYKGFKVLERNQPGYPYSILLEQKSKQESLLFENESVSVVIPQEIETIKKQYTKVIDAYGFLGVLDINLEDSKVLYIVLVTGCSSIGKLAETEIFRISQTHFIPLNHEQSEEHIADLRKLLNSGAFYFSWPLKAKSTPPVDLTLCAQRKLRTSVTDNRFFWNRMLLVHLVKYRIDCSPWVLKIMCGFVEMKTVYLGHRKALAAIISRLSCERTGTRFNVRGINDEGHVANFVESEQIILMDNEITSYLQTRGSVPLFWEQPGLQVGSHKVKIPRGFESSKAAFEKHMVMIKEQYGRQVIVNLLGTSLIGSKEGESTLSNEYQKHHQESVHKDDVAHIAFDYHQECRGGNQANLVKLKMKINQQIDEFNLYHANLTTVFSYQTGTIRTNCLDCLDRTNCVQTFFGLDILEKQMQVMNVLDKKQINRFEEIFKQMWINNGNEISRIYAGTGAIQGGSKLMDGARSAARTIQNNLLDTYKQDAIDILLYGSSLNTDLVDLRRILLPYNTHNVPMVIMKEMYRRYNEFTTPVSCKVVVGTYNVNGGKHFRSVAFKNTSLSDWLLDNSEDADIFAIGFQEIVDLNAANIMASSSEHAKCWADELQKVLSRDQPYVLLSYQQLVGVCLYLFTKPEHIPFIKDVAIDSVKTGMGGHTGNKGAIAIRLMFHGTTMSFVCAHFAAGQSQVAERNADYAEITKRVNFPLGRSLSANEYVFWCGDFNYRVDMDKEELKEFIKQGDLQAVLECDQLRNQQKADNVFVGFDEGEITFPPTYKYDLFSDDYDTSEKCRAPAWTDRILWRRKPLFPDVIEEQLDGGKLLHYGQAGLKQSDHRPVVGVFQIEVRKIDEDARREVFHEVAYELDCPGEAPNWLHQIEEEIALYSNNTVPLYAPNSMQAEGNQEVKVPPKRPPPPRGGPPKSPTPETAADNHPQQPRMESMSSYDEADDDIIKPAPQEPPPPPPPRSEPSSAPPPIPSRPLPPVPARPR